MALLDSNSCECLKSELSLFSVSPTQTSIEEVRYKEYFPISQTSYNAPLEYYITTSDEQYLDLQQSYLQMTVSILDSQGNELSPPAADADVPDKNLVFPINYFAATQFKNVEVVLSGTQISASDVQYAYRAFLETTLTYGAAKRDYLHSAMYYPDKQEPDYHGANIGSKQNCPNLGAYSRYMRTRNSRQFELITRIHNGLFNQQKLLLSKMDLRLKFHRHESKFSLISHADTENYRIHVHSAVMMMCHKRIAASVREAHEIALLKSPAKYNIRTSEVKFYTKPQGSADLSEPNVVTGILPRRVIVGLVSSTAFNGSYHTNPLNFQPFALRSIQLRRNGLALPYDQLELKFSQELVLEGYITLFQGLGRLFHDDELFITRDDYIKSGMTLYAFDITQDGAEHNLSLLQEGTLSLHIKLETALRESATVIVYLEKDGLIEIDKDRNVVFET